MATLLELFIFVFLSSLTVHHCDSMTCIRCETPNCPSGDCLLQCDSEKCAEGYNTQFQNETGTLCHQVTNDETATDSTTDATTDSTTDAPFTPVIVCKKCHIDNCTDCPADDTIYSCTRCAEGLELQTTNETYTSNTTDSNGTITVEVKTRKVSTCVLQSTTPGDKDNGGGGSNVDNNPNDDDGDSTNVAAIAGGAASAGVVLIGGAAVVGALVYRRRHRGAPQEPSSELGGLSKYRKRTSKDPTKPDVSRDSGEQRYVSTPTSPRPDEDDSHERQSEVLNLGMAPPPPIGARQQEIYDALEVTTPNNQSSDYGRLEFKQESTYGNMKTIQNATLGAPANGMPDCNNIYGNIQSPSHLSGDKRDSFPQEVYGNVANGQPIAGDDVYVNDNEGHHQNAMDDVYINEPEPNHSTLTTNAAIAEDLPEDVYLNDGVGMNQEEEENWYGNT